MAVVKCLSVLHLNALLDFIFQLKVFARFFIGRQEAQSSSHDLTCEDSDQPVQMYRLIIVYWPHIEVCRK